MWQNPQETADLVTFTEEILNGKLQFCAVLDVFGMFCVRSIYVPCPGKTSEISFEVKENPEKKIIALENLILSVFYL